MASTAPKAKKEKKDRKSTSKSKSDKSGSRKKVSKWSASTADKYVLYQMSVQAPDHEVEFVEKTFVRHRGRKPYALREDFCGTAFFAAEWLKSNPKRTAVGIDIDDEPVEWGVKHHFAAMNEPGNRMHFIRKSVVDVHEGNYDVAVGFNFSYWLFKTRPAMLEYFKAVRASLTSDGMFFLDMYGGWQAQETMEEPRSIDGKFTYVWEQHEFNPIDNSALNYIHFRFKDGTKMERAFEYSWRLWTIAEIRELLVEAGFKQSTVYWEEEDEKGEEAGDYIQVIAAENQPGWLGYIVAEV